MQRSSEWSRCLSCSLFNNFIHDCKGFGSALPKHAPGIKAQIPFFLPWSVQNRDRSKLLSWAEILKTIHLMQQNSLLNSRCSVPKRYSQNTQAFVPLETQSSFIWFLPYLGVFKKNSMFWTWQYKTKASLRLPMHMVRLNVVITKQNSRRVQVNKKILMRSFFSLAIPSKCKMQNYILKVTRCRNKESGTRKSCLC